MPHVYDVTKDSAVLTVPPPTKPSLNGHKTTVTTTMPVKVPASNPSLSLQINSHASAYKYPTLQDTHMHSPQDETDSILRSPSHSESEAGGGGEDVKMEEMTTTTGPGHEQETIMENGGSAIEKQIEIISDLPISVTSDPGSVPATSPSAAADEDQKSTSHSSPNTIDGRLSPGNVDEKPRSPSVAVSANDGTSADEKPKKPASASAKPKSKRRSPSPEPVPARPRMETIRLEISLGGPEKYAIDVLQLSKETGQRPPTPPPIKRDEESSESEGEGDAGPSTRAKGKGRGKAGKRNHSAEYYDLNDPFIDDSELALDERTYFAQTKQQGFYVSSGEVALLKDKSHKESREGDSSSPTKKPKSRRNLVPTIIPLAGSQAVNAAVASSAGLSASSAPPHSQSSKPQTDPFDHQPSAGPGTRHIPITLWDTDIEEGRAPASAPPYASISTNGVVTNGTATTDSVSALKRKASETTTSGKKKRKTIEIESFHPELQVALYELKEAISRESFEQKGKFPPSLKPILARTALKAISVGEYNDNFFALMPKLFIYNKFTMTKLIKRTVYPDHQKLLLARQEELIEELRGITEEGFEKAKEDYEKTIEAWERKREKIKAGATSAEGTPSVSGGTLPPLTQGDGGADSSMEVDGAQEKGKDGPVHSSQHMPIRRFRLNERMRNIIWELVVLSNESVRIENEKNTLENSTVQVSDQGARKVLYQKIVAAFPEGWMTSGQISREVSTMKKRYEAQQAEGVS